MKISIYPTNDDMSRAAADLVAVYLSVKPKSLIVFPSGESPTGMLKYLIQYAKAGKADFSQCTIIGLDEWVGMDERDYGSCKHYLHTNFFDHLDFDPERVVMFDAKAEDLTAECERINHFISSHGGLDIMIVGIGMNGHLGLNEPGTPFDLYAHLSELAPITVEVGQKYFKQETALTQGITLGLKHFSEAKWAVLIASGEKKAGIIAESLQSEMSTAVPASILQTIKNARILLDEGAASQLKHSS
ncbi:glucosamine-6-phosphate deaminase [Mucilaginibacter psychrotolerans]|uniref:Glucosamine-6-phosphate deaminase n=1 Tax=Mucilaginibacter psychrotolerans TaxID=1524096 RepID=A0A4Y8S2I9_9SPHI|nr:glucosamine-6-phosphate deaminase [Mucilaginibacter psychrotolerans]TFF33253.1 glucosamine-6-phosphate deaminase [Mucilaginibacter psychrotolerans]